MKQQSKGVGMASSGRGGKRENAGRPKSEATKMLRVPEALVDDFKKLIDAHRNSKSLDFDSCIQESIGGDLPEHAAEFFREFGYYEYDLDKAVQIGSYFEIYENLILKLPREERLYIKRLTDPKNKRRKR